MPPRPHAHLMLPSPLGLLEYDVLEDAVFLGSHAKRGLQAAPTPFKGACLALTRTDTGFVARALPGESDPVVNGEARAEQVLADGDRIRIKEQVVLFRDRRGPLAAPASAPPATPRAAPPRRPAPPARHPAVTVLGLVGLVLLLAAVYRTVNHLKAIQGAKLADMDLPTVAGDVPAPTPRVAEAYEQLRDLARRTPEAYADLVARYQAFQRSFEGTAEAEAATDEIRALLAAWARKERADLDGRVESLLEAHQFARALQEVRAFEGRFGSTEAAEGTQAVREGIRTRARAALDALIAKVGPLITPQPREAHRLLIGVGHEFPADMAVEVHGLLERAVARMIALRRSGSEPAPPRRPPVREPPSEPPPFPGADRPAQPADPVPPPRRDGPDPGLAARAAWDAARRQLLQGEYAGALMAYTLLQQQHGNTDLYRAHKEKIAAGRYAAKVGAQGPTGLLLAPAVMKKGRLEVEYEFDDLRVLEEDWTQEQPFASEMPVEMKWSRGSVLMEKASGLLHKLVFLPDVRLEVRVRVRQPHDFGLMAVQESTDFRALLFDVANTMFALKKGAAARVNPGHVLWYMGQGVWSAADADAHGFIKIAERTTVKLESGDVLKMELVRKNDTCQGSFQGKTDGVSLEGRVKGDDGSTMGPGRVGVFTNSGIVEVESARISGVVDLAWFRKQLEFLVSADPGPPGAGDAR